MTWDFIKRGGLVLVSVLLTTQLALADTDYDTARKLRESGDILPLETILQKLEVSHPGKVLEVELEKTHGQLIYEIELLDAKGKVWKLKVDPRSGDVIKQKEDD
jgi:uncharacterized membrane protein YkoI